MQMLVQKNPKAISYQDKTIPDIPGYPSMETADVCLSLSGVFGNVS